MLTPVAAECGGDLANHVRHIAVGNRQPRRGRRARHHGLGEIDAIADIAVLEKIPHGSTTITAQFSSASTVEAPRCGNVTTFG